MYSIDLANVKQLRIALRILTGRGGKHISALTSQIATLSHYLVLLRRVRPFVHSVIATQRGVWR